MKTGKMKMRLYLNLTIALSLVLATLLPAGVQAAAPAVAPEPSDEESPVEPAGSNTAPLEALGVEPAWWPSDASRPGVAVRMSPEAYANAPDLAPYWAADYGSFIWLEIPADRLSSLEDSSLPYQLAETTIGVYGFKFDPLEGEPDVPQALLATPGVNEGKPGLHLIQFAGPISDGWLEDLQATGLKPLQYYAHNAYLIWGTPGIVDSMQQQPYTRWTGAFHPAYKLSPQLDEFKGRIENVAVTFYNDGAVEQTVNALKGLGEYVQHFPTQPDGAFQTAILTMDADRLVEVANLPTVWAVEYASPEPGLDGENSTQIVAGQLDTGGTPVTGYYDWLAAKGVNGNGVTWADVDTGLDSTHPDITERDVAYVTYPGAPPANTDPDGHGSHTAGAIFGDGRGGVGALNPAAAQDPNGFYWGTGMAPSSTLVIQNALFGASWPPAGGWNVLSKDSVTNGAVGSSNSWYTGFYDDSYTAACREHDFMVRDANFDTTDMAEPIIYVFSAGNAGPGAGTLSEPHAAKNPIMVAASANYPYIGASVDDLASFSSRGPTADGRYNPTVAAPGYQTVSFNSSQGSSSCNTGVAGPGGTYYSYCSGTSMACPLVAGGSALIVDWWRQQYVGATPSPAMVKALLVNGAEDMAGGNAALNGGGGTLGNVPNFDVGWGRVNLNNVIRTGVPGFYADQEMLFGDTGETWQASFTVADPAKPVKVSLAWTDAPAAVGANPALVNDLDLSVSAGGNKYWGNNFSGGWSAPGGSADGLNNLENVFLPPGTTGMFSVLVDAANVAGDGVPYNGDVTDQDFALVCYNCLREGVGFLDGTVYDAAGTPQSDPLAGAAVMASTSPTQTAQTFSGGDGYYWMDLMTDTYTVTAGLYGYGMNPIADVSVISGTTTTLNIPLTQGAFYVVSGTVTDAATGWPLYARVAVVDGDPLAPPPSEAETWTDPVTGFYSMTLAEGNTYTFQVEAWVDGYQAGGRDVGPLSADATAHFALDADPVACEAPGYVFSATVCLPQAGGLVVGNVYDANYPANALDDAEVVNDAGEVATTADGGFYTLFSPPGDHIFTATMYGGYGNDVVTVTVVPSDTVAQDFFLPAGLLTYAPEGLAVTVDLGYTATLDLDLTNQGGLGTPFDLQEVPGGFMPLSPATTMASVDSDTNDVTPEASSFLPVAPLAVGDELFRVDAQASTGHIALLGVEYALGSYWVTSGGQTGSGDANYLFQLAPDGTLLNNWPQGTTSIWGWRDLAFDGTYLYASDSGVIEQIDPNTGAVTGVTIPSPELPARALAYDPGTDHFWVANWASDIYEIDRTGAVINRFSNALSAYGMAWDRWSPDGPFLWVWSQDGSPMVLATQIDPSTGAPTGVAFQGIDPGWGTNMAGGATISPDVVPGTLTFVGMHQADADTIVGYDLDVVVQSDAVPWLFEEPVTGTVAALDAETVVVTFDAAYVDQPGEYYAELAIGQDTPYDVANVPVTMTVQPPASWGTLEGTVTGWGICDEYPTLLDGAEVLIESDGISWTLTTDVSGTYQIWIDQGYSPLTVTVTAPDYYGLTSGVMITQGESTVLDFDLRLLQPCLGYDPAALEATVEMGNNDTRPLTLTNTGAGEAAFELIELGGGIPWLAEDPVTGTIPADADFVVDVTFDAGVPETMQPGAYEGHLEIDSNAANVVPNVPVTLTVTPPGTWGKVAGTVTGLGYCDVTTPTLLAGAAVTVEASTGVDWLLTTDVSGTYELWLDEAHGPITLTVTYADHVTETVTGVNVSAGVTTTVDVGLRWTRPCLSVAPDRFDVTLEMGMSTTLPFSLTNQGAGDAAFTLFDEQGGFVIAQSTHVRPETAPVGDLNTGAFSFSADPSPPVQSSSPVSPRPRAEAGVYVLTHSLSQDIQAGNSVACNAGGLHADNSYLRVFDLAAFGVIGEFNVTEVQVGIESAVGAGGTQPVEVRLYTLDGPLQWSNMTLIGSASVNIPDQALSLFHVPVTGVAPDASILVVEFFTPNGQAAGHSLFVGSNNLGQTAPTYLAAAACGVVEPTDTAAIGFPNMHMVMNVVGETGVDAPWLYEDPISGTVSAGSTVPVTLTFDAGVPEVEQPGVYHADLMASSDDPIVPLISVPVTMTVTPPASWGKLTGTVQSLGYCDAAAAPLAGADVLIESWVTTTVEVVSGTTTLLDEDFEGTFPPTGWYVTETLGTGNVWDRNDAFAAPNRTTNGGGSGFSADADSDAVCSGAWDTELWSPVIDLTDEISPVLSFASNFQDYAGAGEAWLDVSTDGGVNWTNLHYQTDDDAGGTTGGGVYREFDLSAYVGETIVLRWRYSDNGDGCAWFWQIDNVVVTAANMVEVEVPISWQLTTDASGAYEIWLDEMYSPLTVTATYPDHEIGQVSGVTVVSGTRTAHNFDLRLLKPCVGVTPLSIDEVVSLGTSVNVPMSLTNSGAVSTAWDASAGASWLSTDPPSGTLAADTGFEAVTATLDAAAVDQPGVYVSEVEVATADPMSPTVYVPVTMTVPVPATYGRLVGTVYSLGYCDADMLALDGVQVVMEDGVVATTTTDINGAYGYWLPAGVYTITFSESEHVTQMMTATVSAGVTTTRNVTLRWNRPCLTDVTPESMVVTLALGMSETRPLTLTNTGAGGLHFDFSEYEAGAGSASDVAWLSQNPISGTVLAEATFVTDVMFDAGAVTNPGDYVADLLLSTDDPVRSVVTLPVTMHVSLTATYGYLQGTVDSLNPCDATTTTLAGADVLIESSTGTSWTVTSGVSGTFGLWLDEGGNPYTVTASYADHADDVVAGVAISGQVTTTVNLDLTQLVPCATVAPQAIHETVTLGVSTTVPLTIGNTGTYTLSWRLFEEAGGFRPRVLAADNILLLIDDIAAGDRDAYRDALNAAGVTWSEWDLDSQPFPTAGDLAPYSVLIWADESTLLPGDAQCQIVADWLVSGDKALFATSVDFLWDLENGTVGQGEHNLYLLFNTNYTADYAGTGIATLAGVPGDPIGDGLALALAGTSDSDGDYADETTGAPTGFLYGAGGSGSGHAALTHHEGANYRTVWLGVNFHNGLTTQSERNQLMDRVLSFLGAGDVPWLFEEPITGTVSTGGNSPVTVTLDAGVPEVDQPGDYHATLMVKSDDSAHAEIDVPVTMTVEPLGSWGGLYGTVRSLGYCDANPVPAEGASVLVESSMGPTWTWSLTADVSGTYSLWLDEMYSPLTVTITHTDHTSATTVLTVSAGTTATFDADLRWLEPCVQMAPQALEITLAQGATATTSLNMSNAGALHSWFGALELNIGMEPMGPLATGGPDGFGYQYADSNEVAGPLYQFIDIAGVGNPLALTDNDFGEIPIGFDFKFYGSSDTNPNVYDTVFVGSNGFLSFESGSTDLSPDAALPDPTLPNNLVAAMWDDLDPGAAGTVYYQSFDVCPYNPDGDMMEACLVVQYDDYAYAGGGMAGTFQVILLRRGSILLQYADAGDALGAGATTGIENRLGLIGLSYAPGLTDELAICFAYPGQPTDCASTDIPWLTLTPMEGEVGADVSVPMTVTFNAGVPEVYQPGTYAGELWISSHDPVSPVHVLPVTMTVSQFNGRLEGTIYGWDHCDATSETLPGADLWIEGASGDATPVVADDQGEYQIWLDEGDNPYTIVVGYPGYMEQTIANVDVTNGATTVRDVALRADMPCLRVTPRSYSVIVPQGSAVTQTLSVINDGASSLNYDLSSSIAWLPVTPTGGTVAPDDSASVVVTFDGTGLTLGAYHGLMEMLHNDPVVGRQFIRPVDMLVVGYQPVLSPTVDAATGEPNSTVIYNLTLINNGTYTDTFDLAVSGHTWTTTVPSSLGPLSAGESTVVNTEVTIPAMAQEGYSDTVTVTVTSRGDGRQVDYAELTTTASISEFKIYVPLVMRDF